MDAIELGEVAEIIAGQHIAAELYHNRPVGTPYLTGPADFGEILPSVTKWTNSPKVFAASTDVLVTVKGAGVGKSNLGCDAAIGRQLMALRPRAGKVLQNYLFHFIRSQEAHIARAADGATVPGIGKDDLRSLKMPRRSIDEQRQIAAILDKADALHRKRKRALELLDNLTQAIFFELFGHSGDDIARWGQPVALRDLADIGSGITKGRKLNGELTREVSYMAVVNVQDRRLDLSKVKTIKATEDEIGRYRLQKGDLLLTEGGDPDKLGRGTLWANEIEEAIHQNHIFRVRLRSNDVLPLFLSWLVSSPYGKRYFLRVAKQTTGIASINKTQLSEFPTIVPPIDLQRHFVHLAEAVKTNMQRLSSSTAYIASLFSSLQHRAFAGEL